MLVYRSTDAKREFGKILMVSQREPVSITKNGRAVAVVLSESDFQALKQQAERADMGEPAGKVEEKL